MNAFYRGQNPVLPGSGTGRRHLKRLMVAAPIVLSIYLLSVGDSGFYQIWHRERQIAELQGDIAALNAENTRLAASAALLERDLSEIERIAREHYGMIKNNETVYMVYPNPPTDADVFKP